MAPGIERRSSPGSCARRSTITGLRGCAHQLAQLVHGDACDAQSLVQTLPFPPFEGDIGAQDGHDQGDGGSPQVFEPGEQSADLRVEKHAGADRDPCPDEDAQRIQEREPHPAVAHRAGERRCDGRKAGNELGGHQRDAAPALELGLRLPHARVGGKRDPAKESEHAAAVEPSGEEPKAVADRAGEKSEPEHGSGRDPAFRRQRAADDQRRDRRNRQAYLLEQHVGEHEREPVALDQAVEHLTPP